MSSRSDVVAALADLAPRWLEAAKCGSVTERARLTALDTLACAARGGFELPGTAEAQLDSSTIAFDLACAVAAGEWDETNFVARQHGAANVLPPALIAGVQHGVSWDDFIGAIVSGYEVGGRLTAAARLAPGVHAHGSLGAIGGAVAAALIRGADAREVARVVRIWLSAPTAGTGSAREGGSGLYHAYFGLAAQRSLAIADLAARGVDGPEPTPGDVLDRLAEVDWPAVLACRDTLLIEANLLKVHPVCADLHPAIEAVSLLLPEIDARENDRPQRIVIEAAQGAIEVRTPRNPLLARFCLPWVAAVLLSRRRLDGDDFSASALADTDLAALAARVEVVALPESDAMLPELLHARATIGFASGIVRTATVTVASASRLWPAEHDRVVVKARTAFEATGIDPGIVDFVLDGDGPVEEVLDFFRLDRRRSGAPKGLS